MRTRFVSSGLWNKVSYSLLHAVLLTLGGISQLLFIRMLNQNLNSKAFTEVMLIMSLSLLVPFIDFGAYNLTLYSFSSKTDASLVRLPKEKKYFSLIYSLCVCGVLIITSLPLLFFSVTFYFGLFIMVSGLTLIGTWSLIVIRTKGYIKTSLFFLNIQWPISYWTMILLSRFHIRLNLYCGLIPSFVTLFIVSVFCFVYFVMKINRRSYKLSDFFSLRLNDFQDRAREVLWFTLIAIPIPLMMQLDKYMYYFFGVRNSLASYSVYMFFFSGVVSIVSVANTVAISERLQQVNGKSNILDVRVLGGLGAISFVFLVPSVFRLAFPHLHPIPYISFLLGLYIFTISIFYNANLAILDIQHLKIRTLQYWLQFVAWLALTSIFIKILGIYDAVICGIVSSVLSYLKIRRISGRLK